MKKILFFIAIFPSLVLAQSQDQNYVKTTTYKVETILVPTPSDKEKIVNTTYYDGLGRPKQQIAVKQSPTGNDIIIPIVYDGFSRQKIEYLPFYSTFNSGDFNDNDAIIPLITTQYNNLYNDSKPYSQKEFEQSPLNRVLTQSAPGSNWALGSGHEIRSDYQTNIDNEVRKFKVDFIGNSTQLHNPLPDGFYPANQLYKTVTKDENWTLSHDKTIQEFKDKEGRVVLKRTFIHNAIPNTLPIQYTDEVYNTYYVYDVYGNLSYVIPPLASDAIDRVYNSATVANRNYPWTKIAMVNEDLATVYDKLFSEYKNEFILNADLLAKYGGQGGFTVHANSNDELVLSITLTTIEPMELRNGEIIPLNEIGDFKDSELGRIIGEGYEYIFTIKKNTLNVVGYGKISNLNVTFNGSTKLVYNVNYPWASVVNIDPKVAQEYIARYNEIDNANVLTTALENPYGATGGVNISIDENDQVAVNFNITSTTPLALKKGIVIQLNTERRIADVEMQPIIQNGLKYYIGIRENSLFIEGDGDFTTLNAQRATTPPLAMTIPAAIIEGLCYVYRYDARNRIIEKKIPGKGWEYIVYDKLDRPVLTQDANLRLHNQWLITTYDYLNRVAYTGQFVFNSINTNRDLRIQLQDLVSSSSNINVNYGGFQNGGILISYDSSAFELDNINDISDFKVYTVNYYDNYIFRPNFFIIPVTVPATITYSDGSIKNTTPNARALQTGSLVRILDTNDWIQSVTAYDDKYRPIWSSSQNSYLNTIDVTQTKFDFIGKVLETKTTHTKTGVITDLVTLDKFTYDDNTNQLVKQTQTLVGNHDEELIVYNKYDEVGKLSQKKVGGSIVNQDYINTVALQTIDYSYNIRGWLKSINNPDQSLGNNLFAFKINYDTPQLAGAKALFNGNISETSWRSKSDDQIRNYKYYYDDLNRLNQADYVGNYPTAPFGETENYNEGNITYDKNGNIITLDRYGLTNTNHISIIDQLSYDYQPKSNKLRKVIDAGNQNGFTDDGVNSDDDYTYDINGNMLRDLNKGINSDIEYNYLNLPTKIVFTSMQNHHAEDRGSIIYKYDANGIKLSKKINRYPIVQAQDTPLTLYAGNYIYENNVLQYFSHAEGYVANDSGIYSYVYQFKDHLGNTRLSYTADTDINGNVILTNPPKIIEENNYYPFGLKQKGYNNVVNSTNPARKKLFNGKELQDELGLNVYDYGNRNYDAAIGRFFNIDRFSEKYYEDTPYHYTKNNPIYFVEVNGDSINVAQKYREQFNKVLSNVFGKSSSNFGYSVAGNLVFNGNVKNLSKEQQAVMKDFGGLMSESTTTNVIFEKVYTVTEGNISIPIDTEARGGEGTVSAKEGGGLTQNYVVVNPTNLVNRPVYEVNKSYYDEGPPDPNNPPFTPVVIQTNPTLSTFHGFGHVIHANQPQNKVLEFENKTIKAFNQVNNTNIPARNPNETHNKKDK